MTQLGPYQPPRTHFERSELARNFCKYPEASRAVRFANLLLDYFGTIGLGIALVVGIEFAFPGSPHNLDAPCDQLLGWSLMIAYYIGFEGLFGWTPGKLVTGTRVVAANGEAATFPQILGRSLARFVPFEPLSFFWSSGGWHDTWSGTVVVQVRGVEPPPATSTRRRVISIR